MEDRATLSQVQIIQSLGKRLADFEEELSWGAPAGELKFLSGRIGELYAAMITRGQMALTTNQRGYDVISAENERVSVKTCTTERLNAQFKKSTLRFVDRIIVLKLHHGEDGVSIEELLDASKDDALKLCKESIDCYTFSGFGSPRRQMDLTHLEVMDTATYDGHVIRRYENGSIVVILPNGEVANPTKAALRKLSAKLGITPDDNPNTRYWGKLVLDYLLELNGNE